MTIAPGTTAFYDRWAVDGEESARSAIRATSNPHSHPERACWMSAAARDATSSRC